MAKILRKTRDKLNTRRNAHAATLKSLPSTVNPVSYRQPGSMKRRKG
jgi:hypothetical protein